MSLPFDKVLVANRGEIACRVIATCRRLGIGTVAVYSDADRDARHVRLADEAIRIGPVAARDSYLRGDRIVEAALKTSAQAVHPGYGFLSENAEFARACARAGLVFIGPPAQAIEAMGSKSAAKALMGRAGVPLIPGYHGEGQAPDFLAARADGIGYPVLIKASAGGGGKGMRRVDCPNDFAAALAACQREAAASFGDARVLVEKYIEQPRHIEVQVFGDMHGDYVHLFERDCSVQRRHQKVLEEAPAPGMTPERRAAMGQVALEAARAIGYVGAGTVEFIANREGDFWFMEMNTRLQVEHPVTEMITGVDLVEWQLLIAAGKPLPLRQDQLAIHGHAIEARLYAEDTMHGFLPAAGKLRYLSLPGQGSELRIDSGIDQGDAVTPYYDPMLAKLIVCGENREVARRRMREALTQCRIVGVTTNIEFLRRLVDTPAFVSADLDTALIEREQVALFAVQDPPDAIGWELAALAWWLHRLAMRKATDAARTPHSPWNADDGWRLCGHVQQHINMVCGGQERMISIATTPAGHQVSLAGCAPRIVSAQLAAARLDVHDEAGRHRADVVFDAGGVDLFHAGRHWRFEHDDPMSGQASDDSAEAGGIHAPMPGRIVALLAPLHTPLAKGAPLLMLEAMKMEYTLQAPDAGMVRAFHAKPGDLVAEGASLVEFVAAAEDGA